MKVKFPRNLNSQEPVKYFNLLVEGVWIPAGSLFVHFDLNKPSQKSVVVSLSDILYQGGDFYYQGGFIDIKNKTKLHAIRIPENSILQICGEPRLMAKIFIRAKTLLQNNLPNVAFSGNAFPLGKHEVVVPSVERQYILRMLIKRPGSNFEIPSELEWLRETIMKCANLQEENGISYNNDFIYVTVRHGIVTSKTDDLWHVDGFSVRKPHRPEQNYIWTNCYPTEGWPGTCFLPRTFDPLKHNLHRFFQNYEERYISFDDGKSKILTSGHLWLIDPFVVHRRPKIPENTFRTFFRVTFAPIEIEDDACTPNPLLPTRKYNNTDFRDSLVDFKF